MTCLSVENTSRDEDKIWVEQARMEEKIPKFKVINRSKIQNHNTRKKYQIVSNSKNKNSLKHCNYKDTLKMHKNSCQNEIQTDNNKFKVNTFQTCTNLYFLTIQYKKAKARNKKNYKKYGWFTHSKKTNNMGGFTHSK